MRFDVCASSYDTYAIPQRLFAARVAAFAQPRPAESVLELGAGTGALTRSLALLPHARLQATDLSPAMLALGQQAVPQVQWLSLDAFSTAPPRAELQISSGLLQWARNPIPVLRQWAAALSSSARMVHAIPCLPCLEEWRALVPESPVVWRDEKGWLELFAQVPLRIRRHELWIESLCFPTALDFVRSLHRSGVTGHARLSAGRLRSAIRTYEARHQTPQGVSSTWAWLAIEAVRF
jgi:SAM-dependent methyltransferase